jgi:hypothetical protein
MRPLRADLRLRLATSNGEREPDWRLTLTQYRHLPLLVPQLQEMWWTRKRPAPPPRTPAPDRRLLLVVSHGLPPDALDREWESAEIAYPQYRHWIVQIKHTIRERGGSNV